MQSLSDERVKELLKIKEDMLEQINNLTFFEAMGVLAHVTGVLLSAIEDCQESEEQRRMIVPRYRRVLTDVMITIRVIEAKIGNQTRGEDVPPKSKLN